MTLLFFILGAALYSTQAALGYSTAFKTSPWFLPAAVSTSVLAGLLWFTIARDLGADHAKVLRYGFIWDSMILVAYALVPVFGFGVKVDIKTGIGLGLIVVGTVILKLEAL